MASGHRHLGDPSYTINQANILGDRPCVRQSQLYRQHCGGNEMKDILGHGNLNWNTNSVEGCYRGRAYNFNGSGQDGGAMRPPMDHQNALGPREQQRMRQEQEIRQQVPPQRRQVAASPQAGQMPQMYRDTSRDRSQPQGSEQEFVDIQQRAQMQVQNGKRRVYGGGPAGYANQQQRQPSQPTSGYEPEGYGEYEEPQQQRYTGVENYQQPGYGNDYYEQQPPSQQQYSAAVYHNDPQSSNGQKPPTSQAQTTPISGSRALRPGAGYANKQTYNIFTGN